MTTLALALVIGSAFIHASWNFLAKRVSGGVGFTWLVTLINVAAYAPVAVYVYVSQQPALGAAEVVIISVSAVLQIAYFLALQRGYRTGEFSVVYPLARGTGPMLSTVAAIALFAERPSLVALLGTGLIVTGVLILTGGFAGLRHAHSRGAIAFGLITGLIIAGYTVWDKRAVSQFHLPPLFYDWANACLRLALLSPIAAGRADDIRRHWREHRREAIGVALLSPLAYIMVLTAMTFSPVSYVAPAREISILIGTLLGTRLLAEKDARRKLVAAGVMVTGVISLAIG